MSKTVFKYIGRTTDFRGNTLWEIVGNLPDWGVGRMVIRNMFQRYPEPCYLRILKVQAVDAEENNVRKVRVTVEKTWRGVTLPKPIEIYSTSYKADYELVPQEQEQKYLTNTKKVSERILPTTVELPPLLREFVRDETGEENPMMKVHFKKSANKMARSAVPGEQPNVNIVMSFGKPATAATKLYETLQ